MPPSIGRYRIEGVLGRGAMGVIYKAHDPEIDRKVALKLVRMDLLESAERDEYLARFRREVQAAGRCMHPNIVAVYDFALHEGDPFIAMEFVQGVSLRQAIESGMRFTPAQAAALVLQMLDALDCAHAMGIVHRDIKPANILLLASAQVKVTDFGISRPSMSDMTQHGAVLGTPSYMSPEQCRGEEVDGRSDLFSTGVVLCELISGHRPFPGRTATEVMARVLHGAPDLGPELEGGPLGEVVARALAKRPEDRFDSAQAMAAALRAATGGGTDRTVVMGAAALPPARFAPDPVMADALARSLARHIGSHLAPRAPQLVQRAAARAHSIEELREILAQFIEGTNERRLFLREATERTRGGTGTGLRPHPGETAQPITLEATEIERAERELTRVLGPIAPHLVRRALRAGGDSKAFWNRLADSIDKEDERAEFLRRRLG